MIGLDPLVRERNVGLSNTQVKPCHAALGS